MKKKTPIRLVVGCLAVAGLAVAAGASAKTLGSLLVISPTGVNGARYQTCTQQPNGTWTANTAEGNVVYAQASGYATTPTNPGLAVCTANSKNHQTWVNNANCPSNAQWHRPVVRTQFTTWPAPNPNSSATWNTITFNQAFFTTHREFFSTCTVNTQNIAFSQGS
jgi:hypothetical protein